ncbi:MAG: GTPase ObgE [Myxococcales bacterium]|nr:GTPase ObgE [Myxococcales bacterium]
MKFVDEVKIYVKSGKGGDGCVAFLRERYRPKGGPSGGDGGRGGSMVVQASRNLGTLLDYRYQQHYRAENGHPGEGRQRYGRKGEDKVLQVPIGTVITDAETGEFITDLSADGSRTVVARGGSGGRGNMHFASSTNQTPRHAEKGEPAIERRLQLTLKLMADVGLVGFPNAGKSTFISRVSAARPKVADYPFTTLVPNLGMVRTDVDKGFVVADIPGLIEGASEGIGLGHRFLRHVERVSVLAFLVCPVPEEGRNPIDDYRVLLKELEAYSPRMLEKPRILVLSKMDLPDTQELVPDVRAFAESEGLSFTAVSSVTGEGVSELTYGLQAMVEQHRMQEATEPSDNPNLLEEEDESPNPDGRAQLNALLSKHH